jgi:hypothetical protein
VPITRSQIAFAGPCGMFAGLDALGRPYLALEYVDGDEGV